MDLTIFFACIAAVAAGASAIMAWTARADSLKAQEAASIAQTKATEIAEKAADALDRANTLAEKHFDDRLKLERRRERARWGALLRGWVLSKSLRATLSAAPAHTSSIRVVTSAEVSDARIALNEATAELLQATIVDKVNKSVDEINALAPELREDAQYLVVDRIAITEQLIESWVADPEGIAADLRAHEHAAP